MKKYLLAFVAAILSANAALAAPVTTGSWHLMPGMNNDADPFFDNVSWDCESCNVGFYYPATEWLDPVAWSVAANTFTNLEGTSAYLADHTFGRDAATGALWLASGHGYTASSLVGGQVLLMRRVGTGFIDYWAAFEDLPDTGSTDRDFNDRVLYWQERDPVLDGPPNNPPNDPVLDPRLVDTPEPALLALALFGVAALAAYRRRLQ